VLEPKLAKVGVKEARFYEEMRRRPVGGRTHVVYGILLLEQATLYLLRDLDTRALFMIANSEFFDVIDNRVSKYWRFWRDITHPQLVYFDYTLRAPFSFIGIDRYISDPDFAASYEAEESASMEYIRQVMVNLEREALSED